MTVELNHHHLCLEACVIWYSDQWQSIWVAEFWIWSGSVHFAWVIYIAAGVHFIIQGW